MAHEGLTQSDDSLTIGTNIYEFNFETQQYFDRPFASIHQKNASVVIVDEPHASSEGQFNLFKGLESFFASNPELIGQTIFLSEGTAAGKSISVQPLIDEEPFPTDDVIHQVLQSHMITGYMAYEWKHKQDIPIIGMEDQALYELSRRFTSLCRENPKAIFQHRKYEDGTEYDIPLEYALNFMIAARNKRIAQTLVENVGTYLNPMLFVASDHVVDRRSALYKQWDKIILRNIIDAQYMGMMGQLQFIPGVMGDYGLEYTEVPKNSKTFDIDHYFEQERIGYTFLSAKGSDIVTPEDTRNYLNVFIDQRK